MLDVAGGHFLAGFLYALGATGFSSVSATTKIAFPSATLTDADGQPTQTVTNTNPDQVAFTGILRDLDAIVSINFRGGMKSVPGRGGLTWTIDGEVGTIKLECQSTLVNIFEPVLTLNGEVVEVNAEGVFSAKGMAGNIPREWNEFAKGSGYSTIEDALEIKRIIDAVKCSAEMGKRIDL